MIQYYLLIRFWHLFLVFSTCKFFHLEKMFSKLTQTFYRATLLHADYNFDIFFSNCLPFKMFWWNLVSKCSVIEMHWNLVQKYVQMLHVEFFFIQLCSNNPIILNSLNTRYSRVPKTVYVYVLLIDSCTSMKEWFAVCLPHLCSFVGR